MFDISIDGISPLLEKVEKLDHVKKMLICFGSIVLTIAAFWYFLIQPKMHLISGLNQQITSMKSSLDSAGKKASVFDREQQEWMTKEFQFQTALESLPGRKEIPSLLLSIAQVRQDAGLESRLFEPKDELENDFYSEIPVNMEVFGNFHNVAVFLDKVSRLGRIVNMKELKVSSEQGKGLRASCTAVTYRFIDEHEQKSGKTKQN